MVTCYMRSGVIMSTLKKFWVLEQSVFQIFGLGMPNLYYQFFGLIMIIVTPVMTTSLSSASFKCGASDLHFFLISYLRMIPKF